MADRESASSTWVCPECQRRVPRKVTACRCGFVQTEAALAAISDPSSSSSPRTGTAALGRTAVVAVVVLGGVAWWYTRARSEAKSPAPTAKLSIPAAPQPRAAAAPVAPSVPPPAPPVDKASPAAPEPPAVATPSEVVSPPPSTLEDLVSRVSPAVVSIQASSGRGSGFFVTPDTVLTNVHVVASNVSVIVRRQDGSTTSARVETQSAPYDIAVLKISNPLKDQPTIPMGSAAGTRVGQDVIAIGTPLGFLQNTVSRGIVSALREVDGATMIQTDAAINPGNSGGPLLDRGGMAIGVIKSGYSGRDGLSFAVAIEHARAVLDGKGTPAPIVTSAPSQYQAISPAVASPGDQRRNDATKAFEQTIGLVARRADTLDSRWRNFRSNCYEGRVVGSFEREWFALWDQRAMQGAVAPGCSLIFGDIRQNAFAIRDAVVAAEEAARQADVYPGTRRDVLRHWKLDYGGWAK